MITGEVGEFPPKKAPTFEALTPGDIHHRYPHMAADAPHEVGTDSEIINRGGVRRKTRNGIEVQVQ